MKTWSWVVMVMVTLGVPGVNYADQDQTQDPGLSVMEEMVVTAGRVKEKKKEITANLTVIDSKEIQMSSALNLGDLLAEKSIAYIYKYPGSLTSVGLRGFRNDIMGSELHAKVLILIDGRRAGTGNVAKISTKNVERIEIIRGPGAVQYGSAAVSGVINVITRQGKGTPHLFAEGTLGSFGFEEESAGLSGEIDRFDVSGSVTTSTSDDYDTASGQAYLNTGYRRTDNYSLNFGYELMPGNRIGVISNGYKLDHQGSPSTLALNDTVSYHNRENSSVDVVYDGGCMDLPLSWMVRYFAVQDEEEGVFPVWAYESDVKTDTRGSQAQISTDWNYFSVTAGIDWTNSDIDQDPDLPQKSESDDIAEFLLAKGRFFNDRLILTGGLRYDTYEVEVTEPAGRTEKDESLIPMVGVAWLPMDYLKFRLNYGEAFVIPAPGQLAGDYIDLWSGTRYVGNPNLKPEKSRTYEGGFDLAYETFSGSLTYFYTDFEDKITIDDSKPGFKTWLNLGESVVSGFESEISVDVGHLLNWNFEVKPYLNFVYLTEYKDKDTDEDLLYTTDINASYGIRVSDQQGFSGYINFAYTGKQKITDYESIIYPYPIIDQGGFTTANMSISKKLIEFKQWGSLTLKGDIQNLFDSDYFYVKGYPMPGRTFFVGLRYDY